MSRPLKVNVGTSPASLKEMTDTELQFVGKKITAPLAASTSGTLTGELNINGTGTVIGEFVDTYRYNPVGTHPVGTTVNSTTYQIKQVLTPVSEVATRQKVLTYDATLGGLKEQDLTFGNSLYDAAIDGIQYKIQANAPTDAGTWVNLGMIKDTRVGSTTNSQVTISYAYLWKRTDVTLTEPTTNYRPLALIAGQIKEINDNQLVELLPTVQNSIINSGIGQYVFQTAAPTVGTWVAMGTGMTDTQYDVGAVNYTGTYNQGYTGYYSQAYTGYYNQGYTGYYSQAYAGNYTGSYSQAYAGNYTGYFAQAYSGAYSQAYAGTYILYYSGAVGGYYTGYYTGYFTGYYTSTYSQVYTGYYSQSYSGTYTGYYSQAYAGTYNQGYTGFYTSTYAGTYSQGYAGTYSGNTVLGTVTNTATNKRLWKRIA